jgi:hypothetical protein
VVAQGVGPWVFSSLSLNRLGVVSQERLQVFFSPSRKLAVAVAEVAGLQDKPRAFSSHWRKHKGIHEQCSASVSGAWAR